MPARSLSNWGAVAVLALAAGCGTQKAPPYSAIAAGTAAPTYSSIVTEYQDFQREWNKLRANTNEPEAALIYVSHGYDLAERSCLQYFTTLRNLRNQTTFYSDSLAALFAAGGVIAGLSGVAAPILVGLFAAGGLVPSTVQSFNNVYLLAEVADDLYPAINKGMAEFRAQNPADKVTMKDGNPVIDRWNADNLVRQYATICSLPLMSTAIKQSVTNLNLTVETDGSVSVKKKDGSGK